MDTKMSVIEIKKLFSKHSSLNFLNDYTLQDVEDAKKRCYASMIRERPNEVESLQNFLDFAAKKMVEDKFMLGTEKAVGAVIKNTVRDSLNPDYKNTVKRLINLDSQYRPTIYPYTYQESLETNYISNLTEKLVNVVSIQLENIQIPFTFYNIEERQGNNFFYVSLNDTESKVVLPDGQYNMVSLLTQINDNLETVYGANKLNFDIDDVLDVSGTSGCKTGKTTLTNEDPSNNYTFTFYDSLDCSNEYTKFNNNIGWILGFRNYTKINEEIVSEYIVTSNNSIISEAVAHINETKYIVVVVDDFNQNQTSGTLVQTNLDVTFIKPTTYWQHQDKTKCLSNLNCENLNDYIDSSRTLTKAQLYSQSQINKNRAYLNKQSMRVECFTPNNVLGIIPFDPTTTWGEPYFNDKIDYKREYHGPIDIEKLHIKLYNDKGIPIHFNGNDWYMSLITEHLYKY